MRCLIRRGGLWVNKLLRIKYELRLPRFARNDVRNIIGRTTSSRPQGRVLGFALQEI